jgi:tRNA A37 threonylcarbamoyladenosine dehydratase
MVGYIFFGVKMVPHRFSRTELLVGSEAIANLSKARVGVIGIGGVGSFVVEALARSGIGNMVLVDNDYISITNINRQIHALQSTVGLSKVKVMRDRVLDINPNARVEALHEFYSEETYSNILMGDFDYIVDAIDVMRSKIDLIVRCKKMNISIISAMGAGNKLDPTLFQIADISETNMCPVAKIIRRELRKQGIENGVKVVFSTEPPLKPNKEISPDKDQIYSDIKCGILGDSRKALGSISFVPSVMGLIIAYEVIKDILKI